MTLGYDPAKRLYEIANGSTTTRFAYDGADTLGEYDASNALQRRYVFDPNTGQPLVWYEGSGTTDRRFMSADERGSIISLTDTSGALVAINRYDEYGKPASTNLGRFQYTGQRWIAEAGLYDYKARDYLPHLGIFAQTDPTGYDDGLNLYAYVHNDPVNLVDPTGMFGLFGGCPSGSNCLSTNPEASNANDYYGNVGLNSAISAEFSGISNSDRNAILACANGVAGICDETLRSIDLAALSAVAATIFYPTIQDAALAAIRYYNPISIATNTEKTGEIFRAPFMGYFYMPPTSNGPAGSDNAPSCFVCSAYYHTHAAYDPRYDNENFSPEDRSLADIYGVPIYLGTPSGAIKVYDPVTGVETQIP